MGALDTPRRRNSKLLNLMAYKFPKLLSIWSDAIVQRSGNFNRQHAAGSDPYRHCQKAHIIPGYQRGSRSPLRPAIRSARQP
jgi:hypothetical protein